MHKRERDTRALYRLGTWLLWSSVPIAALALLVALPVAPKSGWVLFAAALGVLVAGAWLKRRNCPVCIARRSE